MVGRTTPSTLFAAVQHMFDDETTPAKAQCPNMAGCTMFPLLSMSGTLKTWQARYCSGEFTTCERYKLTQLGKPVAPDLMPNGVRLGDRKKNTP